MSASFDKLIKSKLTHGVEAVDYNKPCATPSFISVAPAGTSAGSAAATVVFERRVHDPIYGVWFHRGDRASLIAFFTFTDGSFRYVGMPQVPSHLEDAASTSTVHLESRVAATKLLHNVFPIYPVAARSAHIQGAVVLHAVINKDGTVRELELVSGSEALAPAAAVKQRRYTPTLLNGNPVNVDTCVTVIFNLGG